MHGLVSQAGVKLGKPVGVVVGGHDGDELHQVGQGYHGGADMRWLKCRYIMEM